MTTIEMQYEFLRIIGYGGFSQVQLACHRLTGTQVAIKITPRRGPASRVVAREIDIMKKLHHPNIIKLYQISRSLKYAYIIMQFAEGGDLHDHICQTGTLEEGEASTIFGQILCGVRYLHRSGIVHGDLKPENILIDVNGTIKISDFGLSSYFTEGVDIRTNRGTDYYLSPERLLDQAYDGPKADIWCLGVILYEMIMGYKPFYSHRKEKLFKKIKTEKIWTPPDISNDVKELINLLLRKNPLERPSLESIMEHRWVARGQGCTAVPPPVSTGLNPKVVRQMQEMGFRPRKLCLSVRKQKYDKLMCLYLLLQEQEDLAGPAQPAGPESPATPAVSTSAVPEPGRIGDPPADAPLTTGSPPPPVEAALPALSSVSAGGPEPESHKVSRDASQEGHQPGTSHRCQGQATRVQRMRRRVADSLRRLASCVRLPKTHKWFKHRVVPVKGEHETQP
uniref:sperm motility kinase Y-like n=1 Tax=Jaculus jaculus TaxID=51337 RepID=UPI001E1B05AC|nr:sperm motility kinase Y-like [Jaculus jaculus]